MLYLLCHTSLIMICSLWHPFHPSWFLSMRLSIEFFMYYVGSHTMLLKSNLTGLIISVICITHFKFNSKFFSKFYSDTLGYSLRNLSLLYNLLSSVPIILSSIELAWKAISVLIQTFDKDVRKDRARENPRGSSP